MLALRGKRRYGLSHILRKRSRSTLMLRIALIDILLFALPFILYAAYMIGVKGASPAELWQGAPVFWLLAAGCGLLLVVMATLIQFSGGSTTGTYHPPVIEDGIIKPGGID